MLFLRWVFWAGLLINTAFAAETININRADAAQIASALSGVGEKKAQQIVAWRKAHGEFKTLDDLAKVKGMSAKLVERNRHLIVFSSSGSQASSVGQAGRTEQELTWPTSGMSR